MNTTRRPQPLDKRGTLEPTRDRFVEVRGASGKLLGYYNPDTHQWKYEDRQRTEIVDLTLYRRRT